MPGTLYKPYVWIKSISTSESRLHFIVSLPNGWTIPNEPNSHEDIPDRRKRTLIYEMLEPVETGEVEADYNNIERFYILDDSTEYDPILDDIIVQIWDAGRTDKKGQGSIHHSEGDTSGGE